MKAQVYKPVQGLIVNHYRRKCTNPDCNVIVEPGQGFYHGKKQVYCTDCSLEQMIQEAEVIVDAPRTDYAADFFADEDMSLDLNFRSIGTEYD